MPRDGSLKVTTTNLKAGFLRKNGVPYSENASLTEYYELVAQPDGAPLLVVTIVTTDPVYLRQPFVITSHFKKEPGGAKWNPTALLGDVVAAVVQAYRPAGVTHDSYAARRSP